MTCCLTLNRLQKSLQQSLMVERKNNRIKKYRVVEPTCALAQNFHQKRRKLIVNLMQNQTGEFYDAVKRVFFSLIRTCKFFGGGKFT